MADLPDSFGKPPAPLADTTHAKHEALVARTFELTALHDMPMNDAMLKALNEIDPDPESAVPPLTTAGKVVLGFVVLAIALGVTPLLLWFVGHAVFPFYRWGAAWL